MAGTINFGILDPNTPERVGSSIEQGRRNALVMQQAQQEQQMNALKLQQAQQEMEGQNALRKIYQESGGDTKKVIEGLKKAGQYPKAMQMESQLQKQLSDQDKAALELQKTKMEMGLKHFDYISQSLSGVKDQNSYDIARQHIGQTLGEDALANIPEVYNPSIIEQKKMQALPLKEQLAEQHRIVSDQLNQQRFGYQQQRDIAQMSQAERHFQAGQGLRQQELALKGKEVGGAAVKASEDERKAAGWLSQADNAYKNMLSAMGKEPSASEPGLLEAIAPEQIKGAFQSESRQQFKQGVDSLSEALLRAATGAGVNESEAKQKIKELTPSYLDKPAVKKQKLDAIPVYIASLKTRAGRASPESYSVPERGKAGAAQEPDLDALLKMYGGK